MVKLLFFHFRVTNSRLRNKKLHLALLTRWAHFYFVTFELRTLKLITEKISLIIVASKWHGLPHLLRFLYLACFVVSTYVIFL